MQIEQTPWIALSLLNDLMCKTETHMTAKTKCWWLCWLFLFYNVSAVADIVW